MDSVVTYIVDTLADKFAVPREQLTPDAEFDNLGLDSLVLTELVVILQGRYGVRLDESEVTSARTVIDVAALVRRESSAAA
jgi:acyl carrier protein